MRKTRRKKKTTLSIIGAIPCDRVFVRYGYAHVYATHDVANTHSHAGDGEGEGFVRGVWAHADNSVDETNATDKTVPDYCYGGASITAPVAVKYAAD
eukprot:CAMPEP_0202703594 /NCGR_PEP_ID=MMETSP1385-20130828/16424_1 /ASSEMBLY_ACC=CAM_ASM_000861 /TAXON_ID=933848 /ORGANISM="Elphidium margaritaceum" /LENGTH=96 /DNA_ID=CAMNT_0049361475 /DNA_START=98 /DNA_END=388 /DNA_ORIENTATION=+